MKIPEYLIENIKSRTDIIEIISEYVVLRKYGANFKGLCPFHKEKSPSFTVSSTKSIYKCFGCGKSGNVFTFLMDYHGMTFYEAVESIAKKYGIAIENETNESFREQSKKELAIKALQKTSELYVSNLKSHEGKNALAYFTSRKLSPATIKNFNLGYSSESWNDVMNILLKEGYSEQTLIDAGLIIKNENNQTYDRFRGRAMFPITDFLGRTIGFGARQLNNDPNQGKYINSPQSFIYDKSKVLYGLSFAKNPIRAQGFAYLVEGYLDFLTLFQAGIENVVASSGTALTNDQLDLLSRYTNTIYICYDADSAGIKAAERAFQVAIPKGFNCYIVQLPLGDDPDSIISDRGKDTFLTYVDKKIDYIEFKYNKYKIDGLLDNPAEKAKAIREIVGLISKIPDKLLHDLYISKFANLMKLNENQIKTIYDEKIKLEINEMNAPPKIQHIEEEKPQVMDAKSVNEFEEELTSADILKDLNTEEVLILKTILNHHNDIRKLDEVLIRLQNYFLSEFALNLLEIIREKLPTTDLINNIIFDTELSRAYKDSVAHLSLEDQNPSENWNKNIIDVGQVNYFQLIVDGVNKLKLIKIDKRIQEILSELKTSQNPNELALELTNLTNEKNEINKAIFS